MLFGGLFFDQNAVKNTPPNTRSVSLSSGEGESGLNMKESVGMCLIECLCGVFW